MKKLQSLLKSLYKKPLTTMIHLTSKKVSLIEVEKLLLYSGGFLDISTNDLKKSRGLGKKCNIH